MALSRVLALNTFPIATNLATTDFGANIVSDGTNYLIGTVSGSSLACQLVSSNGQLLGSSGTIGANPGFPPAVALAGGKSGALVVWSDYSLASGVTMFGQLLTLSGSKVGSAFPLLPAAGSHGFQAVQAAASDGTNYLVLWKDDATTSFYGQIVTAAGALSGAEFLLYSTGNMGADHNSALCFGGTNYLLAWQSGGSGANQTYGRFISRSGSASSTFQISQNTSLDQNPVAAAYDGTNYLVVWDRDTQVTSWGQPIWNLCGRLVSSTGAGVGNEQVLVTEQACFPALAFDGANYLLAWGFNADTTNADITVHARFVDPSGNLPGPVFTPFSTQGTNPPLLPLNGLYFSGNRYMLAATFGRFQLNGSGDVVGFSGGDVYGTFIPSSATPPVFTGGTIAGGQFKGQLKVVPGQSYTIEYSSNLVNWLPGGVVSSSDTNQLDLTDDRGVAGFRNLFYRAVIGNRMGPSRSLFFLEFANGGSFGAGYTPNTTFPVALAGYIAAFEVENDNYYPAVTNVFFTGPAGSGLSSTMADPNNSSVEDFSGWYQSPFVSSPAAAPGGNWVVNYNGTNLNFNLADPQAASRLVIPLPTVTVSGGVVQNVTWTYRNSSTGAVLSGPPAYMTDIQLEIDGTAGGRIYQSPELSPATTSHSLTSSVTWLNVQSLYLAYDDSLGNHYVVMFTRP